MTTPPPTPKSPLNSPPAVPIAANASVRLRGMRGILGAMSAAATLDEAIEPLRADPSRAAILLDIDGTLAPIVRHADDAHVPEPTRTQLIAVAKRYAVVGCISGRQAATARQMVSLGSIAYAGNHGAELLPPGGTEVEIDPEVAPHEEAAERALREVAERAEEEGLAIHWGRKVLEIRPPVALNKGRAARRLLEGRDLAAALYVGDDRTDLDAFAGLRALVEEGLLGTAVCVGVRSDETPRQLEEGADVLVDGPLGVRGLLAKLAT